MGSVYRSSVITISASDALNSNKGFLSPRPRHPAAPITFKAPNGCFRTLFLRPEITADRIPWSSIYSFFDGPVWTRAWTLQEWALPERILHYTKHQMVFECLSGSQSEAYPSFERAKNIDINDIIKIFLRRIRHRGPSFLERLRGHSHLQNISEECYRHWFILKKAYSWRKLTFQRDRLNAIEAAAVASALGDRFVCGIWQNDFERGNLWVSLQKEGVLASREGEELASSTRILLFPSWTWASRTTPTGHLLLIDHLEASLSSLKPYIGSSNIDISEANHGRIKIHGLCRQARDGRDASKVWQRDQNIIGSELIFDNTKNPPRVRLSRLQRTTLETQKG